MKALPCLLLALPLAAQGLTLKWNASPAAEQVAGYRIERASGPSRAACTNWYAMATVPASQTNATGRAYYPIPALAMTPGTVYGWRVSATNAWAAGGWSSPAFCVLPTVVSNAMMEISLSGP